MSAPTDEVMLALRRELVIEMTTCVIGAGQATGRLLFERMIGFVNLSRIEMVNIREAIKADSLTRDAAVEWRAEQAGRPNLARSA